MNNLEKVEFIISKLEVAAGFPNEDFKFLDIFSAMRDKKANKMIKELFVDLVKKHFPDADFIVGIDARGFLFGFMVAAELELGFVPVRKVGKLPFKTITVEVNMAYNDKVTLEIQKNAFNSQENPKCVIIDDILATGGSIYAAKCLAMSLNAEVLGAVVLVDKPEARKDKDIDNEDIPIYSIIEFFESDSHFAPSNTIIQDENAGNVE